MSEEAPREHEEAPHEQEPRISPKVWVASLSDYNAGCLHGAWIDADQEPDGICSGINELLRTSQVPGAEEWSIFDYEGFGVLTLSEHETVECLSHLGRGIGEHGEAFAVFAHFFGQRSRRHWTISRTATSGSGSQRRRTSTRSWRTPASTAFSTKRYPSRSETTYESTSRL